MIVVFDTNVLISALQFGQSYGMPVRALEKAMREDRIATADELDREAIEVLIRKFRWEEEAASRAIGHIHLYSIRCRLRHTLKICRDPKDDIFLECAALAKADLLIAGDKDLLVLGSYKRTEIITPAEYVRRFP